MTVRQVEQIHSVLITQFGGSHGVRDYGALSSALSRLDMTFDGEELYPGPINKAAALIESILTNHPFVDGNKRTGYVLKRLLLIDNKIDIVASQEEKYRFVIRIASGMLNFRDICYWLELNTKNLENL